MKIYQLSTRSRVVQTRSWRYLQALVHDDWITVSKHPAAIRRLPEGVKIIGSA